MKRLSVSIVTMILLLISPLACKPRRAMFQLQTQSTVAQTAPHEQDLPPRGRSAFDVMTWQWAREQNSNQSMIVPFPFTDLLTKISGPYKKLGVLVPKSRSLQKFAAAPDYYQYPRVLAVSTREDIQTTPGFKVHRPGEIFIGYSEKAEALEVISFNNTAGRFEFQIVKDYAAGKTPKVFYAERKVCTPCHQNQGPIFSPDPWSDTNANESISELLQAARPADDSYQGIAFQQRRRDEALKLESYEFDELVRKAELIQAEAIAWYEGCGDFGVTGQLCRDSLVRHSNASTASEVSVRVKERLKSQWQNKLGFRIPVLSSIIPNIDTVTFEEIPVAANPITKRNLETSLALTFPDLTRSAIEHIPGARNLVSQALTSVAKLLAEMERSSDPQAAKLRQVVAEDRDISLYFDRTDVSIPQKFSTAQLYNPDSLALGLAQESQVLSSTELLSDLAEAQLPSPSLLAHISNEPKGLAVSFATSLGKFIHYCAPCHRGDCVGPAFLDGMNEQEMTKNLRHVAKEAASRLAMTLKESPLAMPPSTSPSLVRQLEASPEHRTEMLRWLEIK